jgi:hypothetical protein
MISEVLARPVRYQVISEAEWAEELTALAAEYPDTVINAAMARHITSVATLLTARSTAGSPTTAGACHAAGRETIDWPCFLRRHVERSGVVR